MLIAYRRREEPEEHVGLGAGVGGDEAGVALQVCYFDALHGLDHSGQLPPQLHISALNVGREVEGLAHILREYAADDNRDDQDEPRAKHILAICD